MAYHDKPWMRRRDGETIARFEFRVDHSCYNCGAFIVDTLALNRHEDECRGANANAKGDHSWR